MNRMLWPTELRRQMVAGVGFEPHDLRVMSPTSYQTALSRDISLKGNGAGNRARTGTRFSSHRILSPGRLPIPPFRHMTDSPSTSFPFRSCLLYHSFLLLSSAFIKKCAESCRITIEVQHYEKIAIENLKYYR